MEITKWKSQMATWNHALQVSAEKLDALQDRYYGKRCFIIGNGPSLNQIDWPSLQNEYTFGLNKIYLLFDTMGFAPSFYMCINPLVIEQSINEIYKIPSEKFLPSNYIQLVEYPKEITFFKTSLRQYFSKDASKEVSEGYTVTFAALQMAYYMGFRQVVLIGVDHSFQYTGAPNSIVISEGDDLNHFNSNYFGKGMPWQLPDLEKSVASYKLAKSFYESDGRIVLDGTINGKLTVFPKIDYLNIVASRIKHKSYTKRQCANTEIERDSNIKSTSKYKISVVVPAQVFDKQLVNCLNDLESQTIAKQMEIIIVDMDPKQRKEVDIQELQGKYNNIQYIQATTLQTKYQAWNQGIHISCGQYVTCASPGDRYTSGALEMLVTLLEINPGDMLVFANSPALQDTRKTSNLPAINKNWKSVRRMLYDEYTTGACYIWRRTVHDEFGYFDDIFLDAGDYEFLLRVSQKYSIHLISDTLVETFIYRQDFRSEKIADNLHFEISAILKCYKYADLEDLTIDEGGLSKHPLFSDWCEFNIMKRNVNTKLKNPALGEISKIFDWRSSKHQPKLSIVITTYNREEDLFRALFNLDLQSEKDLEIIVVNNGKPIDNLIDRIPPLSHKLCFIQLKANYGPSLARNLGVEHSRGEIVGILDDDTFAEPDWASKIIFHFQDKDLIGLRGRVLPKENKKHMHLPLIYNPSNVPIVNDAGLEMGAAFRKTDFTRVGGYDEHLYHHEGTELAYRISKAHNNRLDCIMYFPDITIYHTIHENPNHLTIKILRNKENMKMILQKYPDFDEYHSFFWHIFEQDLNNYNWNRLLMRYCYLDNPNMAIEFARQSTKISPFAIQPYLILSGSYFKLGQFQKCVAALEIAVELMHRKTFDKNVLISGNTSASVMKRMYAGTVLCLAYLYLKIRAKPEFEATIRHLEELPEIMPIDNDLTEKGSQISTLAHEIFS